MDQLYIDEQKYWKCTRCEQINPGQELCQSQACLSKMEERLCLVCKQIKPIYTGQKNCSTCVIKSIELKFGRCIECKIVNTGKNWCRICNSKRFQQNFNNWTSGNDDIDKFIQNIQLSALSHYQLLEWIPYERFSKPIYIAEGGFGKVYKAKWKDGYILYWDLNENKWKRNYQNDGNYVDVALKILNNSQKITFEFINEIALYSKIHEVKISDLVIRCYGISQDPETKDYIMVMKYADNGNLRNYLRIKKKKSHKVKKKLNLDSKLLTYKFKINIIKNITSGLKKIHGKGFIHRDLHIGNIVCFVNSVCITDMGFCKPANYNELENTKKNVYGVLPYVAPEILRGNPYTKFSDIYSLGIIMYEILSELPPYYDISHDGYLALNICKGLRPRYDIEVPQLILHVIKRCLDANPLNRPSTKELARTFNEWIDDFNKYLKNIMDKKESIKPELVKQIEDINDSSSDSNLSKMHPKAIYTSRLLDFNNLPKPKNSHDYYKDYNNISNLKYSEPDFSWSSNSSNESI
ncbi:kinase-like domain-containing protein [Glomus cerebriforme]|uniref:Kinase-like domain-containing protein n=1 Tax=Glomus cerebriforme TaxID=658196 RepID=A0A397TB54_9GLOM|nr:kinase-like domain-containing protein [Glomus cerebriforme]